MCWGLRQDTCEFDSYRDKTLLSKLKFATAIWGPEAIPACTPLQFNFFPRSKLFSVLLRVSHWKSQRWVNTIAGRLYLTWRSNEWCMRTYGKTLIEIKERKFSITSVWTRKRRTFVGEIWMWIISFWMRSITFSFNKIKSFLQVQRWRLWLQNLRPLNLNLTRITRLVHQAGTHYFTLSKSQFSWWRTCSASSVLQKISVLCFTSVCNQLLKSVK